MLYEILAGRPPHEADSVHELVRSIRASRPPLPADAPLELVRICRRAMDADPAGRFERVEQMRLALAAYLQHRGSMRLAEHASRRLEALRELLAAPAGDPAERRQRAYKLFGECRFGFLEALTTSRDNDLAAEGLRGAVAAMADYELDQGAPEAAAALLAELPAPHPELEVRIEAALAARADDKRRVAELERLGRDLDMSVGQRTRWFLAVVLGGLWTLLPLLGAVGHSSLFASYDAMMVWPFALMLVVGLAVLWARDSLTRTAINRRLAAAMFLVLVAQAIMLVGLRWLGVSEIAASALHPFLWFCVTSMLVITVNRRLLPTAVVQMAAFLVAARWPQLRFYALSAGNGALAVNAATIWRPRSPRPAPGG